MRSHAPIVAACAAALALAGCRSCEPVRPPRVRPPARILDRTTVLAVLPEEGLGVAGHAAQATGAMWTGELIFSAWGGGVAWSSRGADAKMRVYHDGVAGPPFDELTEVAVSPDGRHWAYAGLRDDTWRAVIDGVEGPPGFDALESFTYSPDGAHLLYLAIVRGERRLYVDGVVRRTAPGSYLRQGFSADSAWVLVAETAEVASGHTRVVAVSVETGASIIVLDGTAGGLLLSPDGTRAAALARDPAGVRVVSFDTARPLAQRRGRAFDRYLTWEFGSAGDPLAYVAVRGGRPVLVIETDEIEVDGRWEIMGGAAVWPGRRGFGALVRESGTVTLREFFTGRSPPAPAYEEAFGLAYGDGGRVHAYAARRGDRWFVVANGKEGPPFDAVRPPEFSPDGRFLVYRARRDGKRFVVVADRDGRTIREDPPFEQVHDVRFTADGRSIGYGVKDGRTIAWRVSPL
jgi:hypothetical protein